MATNVNWNIGFGSGLPTMLFITFLILKLTKVISWSWWWVFAPIWGSFVILIFILFVGGFILLWGKHHGKW